MFGVWGKVSRIIEVTERRQTVQVFLEETNTTIRAIHYFYDQDDQLHTHDVVQVNTSALDLGLGTGGYGFVMGHLPGECLTTPVPKLTQKAPHYAGHIMKIRYTASQRPVLCVEAPESEYHQLFQSSFSLQNKLILVGELHSMLPVLALLIQHWRPNRQLVYIMDDQAALQMAFSKHIPLLKKMMNLTTITYGQAVGGDLEAVNLYTALEAAVKVAAADDIIITQGPGVAGTSTQTGFSGMQLVHWIHTIYTCGGRPVVIPRISFADQRARHRGFSAHLLTPLLDHVLTSVIVPFPFYRLQKDERDEQLEEQLDLFARRNRPQLRQGDRVGHRFIPIPIEYVHDELQTALAQYAEEVTTMGRSFQADPYFFYAIAASYFFYREALIRYDKA